jgi:hypothetical protein
MLFGFRFVSRRHFEISGEQGTRTARAFTITMMKRSHTVSLLDDEDSSKPPNNNKEKESKRNKRQKGQNDETVAAANVINVISLLDSDEEGDAESDHFLASNTKSPLAPASTTNIKKEGGAKYDNNGGGGKLGATAMLQQQGQADDDVMVVDPVLPEIHPVGGVAAAAAASANNDDDIQLVGTANETRLPHMRQHCTEYPFVSSGTNAKTSNETYCDLCYCYVCDKPAKECAKWTSPSASQGQNHCMATDMGAMAPLWRSLRQQAKNPTAAAVHPHSFSVTPGSQIPGTFSPIYPPFQPLHSNRLAGSGPWEPTTAGAAQDETLTECRKCGWYTRFDHESFSRDIERVPGCLDWCHACGRIASEEDFERFQAIPYTQQATDIFLGEKEVSFRLHAHDPRLFDKYKANWEANADDPKWTFDESEMEQDLFRHRFGSRPYIDMILASIPVVAEDKIPQSAVVTKRRNGPYESHSASADETEALLVQLQNDRAILEELMNFGSIGREDLHKDDTSRTEAPLDGNIMATWDTTSRSGVS